MSAPQAPSNFLAKSIAARIKAAGVSSDFLSSLKKSGIGGYAEYQTNPIAFGENLLDDHYTDDVKTLIKSVMEYPITIAKSANGVGKTHVAARIAIWFYKVFTDAQVYTAAAPPEDNLRLLLWGEIGGIVHKYKQLFTADRVKDLHIERNPQSFITGVTVPSTGSIAQREARFSGKHSPHIFFIVDEGDAVPDEVYRGIESCMSGGFARLLVLFNPRAEIGPIYQMERDRRANVVSLSAFRHPNVVEGRNIIPGAVDRETTIRRINLWSRPLVVGESPDTECFELPEFLVGCVAHRQDGTAFEPLVAGYYRIMEPALSYMVLGRYPAQSSTQLISRVWIDAARSRWDKYVQEHGERSPVGIRPVQGVDVGEFGSDSSCSCLRFNYFVARLTRWSGVDTMVTGDKAAAIYHDVDAIAACVDATGVGAGVAPHMQRQGCNALAIKVGAKPTQSVDLGEFGNLRDQGWWMAREFLRINKQSMLPPDEKLLEELATPTYEIKNGKIKVMDKATMREILSRSPDDADSFCLTFGVDAYNKLLCADITMEIGEDMDIGEIGEMRYPEPLERIKNNLLHDSVLFGQIDGGRWCVWDMPKSGNDYIIACKTTGNDMYNIIEVLLRDETGLRQVAEFRSEDNVFDFGVEVRKCYLAYKHALIVPMVISGDHSRVMIELIKDCRIYRRQTAIGDDLRIKVGTKPGIQIIDEKTQNGIIDALFNMVNDGMFVIRSKILESELHTYGQEGSAIDTVMTAAIGVQAHLHTPQSNKMRVITTKYIN